MLPHHGQKAIAAFLRREGGALTLEGVLWVPVYLVFFALIADTSLIFNGQSQMQRVLQDVNRLASSGYIANTTDAKDRIKASLTHLSPNVVVSTTLSNGIIVSTATIPATDLMAIGLVTAFKNLKITVTAQHLVES